MGAHFEAPSANGFALRQVVFKESYRMHIFMVGDYVLFGVERPCYLKSLSTNVLGHGSLEDLQLPIKLGRA